MDSLIQIAQELHSGRLSPVELTRSLLQRIDEQDPQLHSYTLILREEALAQARQAEREIAAGELRGPLHGVPIAVKDICFTRGVPTTCGSALLDGWLPEYDATVVTRLLEAGAILIGKVHMTEFAFRWHRSDLPQPVNPWNAGRWPGASSSGSGVAVAAGLCFGALGTDTGGSIRFPAACNGVVGLKPTYGRVSRYGVFPLAETLDHIGPLTRRVADAAAILQAIAGYDPADPTSHQGAVPDYSAALHQGIDGLRLGVDQAFISDGVDDEVRGAVTAAIELLEDAGAVIVPVTVPDVSEPIERWPLMCAAEALVAHQATYPARVDEYGPFEQFLRGGLEITGQAYAETQILRERFSAQFQQLFDEVDLLVCPTMPHVAPPLDDSGQPVETVAVRARFTYPINFARNPTLSQPCGFNHDNMPMSIQFIGPHFGEATLLRIGQVYEDATAWHEQLPPLVN